MSPLPDELNLDLDTLPIGMEVKTEAITSLEVEKICSLKSEHHKEVFYKVPLLGISG